VIREIYKLVKKMAFLKGDRFGRRIEVWKSYIDDFKYSNVRIGE
jgi:hypothetical protein